MEINELKYLVAIYSLPAMSQRRLKILFDYFQSFEYAWHQSDFWSHIPEFVSGHGELPEKNLTEDQVELLFEKFLKSEAKVTTFYDEEYPSLLKNIYDPPFVLFYRGRMPKAENICIGMVGSRKATAYGRLMAETLARDLAGKGIWVVSGMARGIDTYSHQGCLKAGGMTVAVLGSGIDVVYPRENKSLYEQIIASGLVISEFPLGTPPLPQHFPARNRIISGMSRGVIVVEAAEKSGSLITVDFALEQGRDVFALPGPVTSPLSRGTHKLIRQGAKLVENANDILEEYIQEYSGEIKTGNKGFDLFAFSQKERDILELLLSGSMHFDDLATQSGIGAAELASLLTQLEIKGLVKQTPGKYYIIGSII
ncbi:MAG: DNA-processing protein DprA [Bacillota bacterium]|nr:DNA-protecting protein DprA [Clostridia bacterium]